MSNEVKTNRIMIIDRSEVARSIISHIFHKEIGSAQIVDFGSAEDALVHLEREKYDLITTSLFLPGLDGLDLCHKIRSLEIQYLTPVVVVSGDADRRLLREGFSAGVTDYFNKSLGYDKLARFIGDVLQRHAGLVGRVLYVEDSITTAEKTIALMHHHGLQVTHFKDGESALALLQQQHKNNEDNFDLVFTDFFLEKNLSGGDLLSAIRTQLNYSQQQLPVLVVTIADNTDCQSDVFHVGANDFITKPLIEEVFIARIKSLLMIKQQHRVIKSCATDMEELRVTDEITRIHNKKYLLDKGAKFLKKHPQLCLLMVDIDQLKDINTHQGHLQGDYVLYVVAQMLVSLFENKGLVTRFFGNHFVLLLPNYNLDTVVDVAEALRKNIMTLKPEQLHITTSIGVASSEAREQCNLEELLLDADNVLRIAKIEGGNAVCLFTTDNDYCLVANSN